MSDKEKIKEEIKRQKSFCKKTFDVLHPDDLDATIAYAQIELLDRLIQFINSLPEEHNEDLEEEINKVDDWYPVELKYIQEIARHFAEWQKQQMKETLKTEYEKGRIDMQQEMIKDSVDAIFIQDYAYKTPVLYGDLKYKMNIVSGQPIKLYQIKKD